MMREMLFMCKSGENIAEPVRLSPFLVKVVPAAAVGCKVTRGSAAIFMLTAKTQYLVLLIFRLKEPGSEMAKINPTFPVGLNSPRFLLTPRFPMANFGLLEEIARG